MPYELPPDPSTERRTRVVRSVSFAFAAVLVALLAYFGYIGYEGSRQLTGHAAPSADCRTPATFGWEYEAINYDAAADATLGSEPKPEACVARGGRAGGAVAGPGDVPIAGWYVPAAGETGPTGPTVVLAHGWGSNKSNMLDRAALLHESYNLVLFDFRNHGQSGEAATTQGVLEAGDVRAMIDWLDATKGPQQIAVLGVSMGGASVLYEAGRDPRVDALIVESTHATLANAIRARLEGAGYPFSIPGTWATLLGTLLRTGQDVTAADPVLSIERLDGRPVLLIYGGMDTSIGPNDASEMLAAAREGESPVTLHVCAAATHARSDELCAQDYAGWVLGFLSRALAPTA